MVALTLTRATLVMSRSSSVPVRPKLRRPPTSHHQLFRLLDLTADRLPGDGLRPLGHKMFFVVVDLSRCSFYDSLWACFMTPNIRLSTTNQNLHKIMHQPFHFASKPQPLFSDNLRGNSKEINKQLGKDGSLSIHLVFNKVVIYTRFGAYAVHEYASTWKARSTLVRMSGPVLGPLMKMEAVVDKEFLRT